jgi:hypothetical protein
MPYGQIQVDTVKDSLNNTFAPASSVFRNRIINGAMVISQRNGTSSVTPASGDYLLDRYQYGSTQASKFTVQQNAGSVTPPTGFINYMGFTVASAVSVGAGDYFNFLQTIEGFNTADLGWGTANAKTVTLSFQVYSSLTGTFGGCLNNYAFNRSYPFTFTISSANTWTQISITIAGDTSGTWNTNNSGSIVVRFSLGTGSTYSGTAGAWTGSGLISATGATSVVGTSGATFYITGVQLEVGTNATNFDYRPYTTELQLCQRYCYNTNASTNANTAFFNGEFYSSTLMLGVLRMPVTMRAQPSASSTGSFTISQGASAFTATSISINQASPDSILFQGTVSGATAGVCRIAAASTSTAITITAEL